MKRRIYFLFYLEECVFSKSSDEKTFSSVVWIVPIPFGAALRVTQKGIEKHFTHSVGWPKNKSSFYKDFTPAGGFSIQTFTFLRKPFSLPAHFQWRKNGKNAVALCDGIGLGMLSKNSPSKGRILKEDIPDIKAFFSCEVDGAKSHLK
ncbi:hypothetical protein [Sphingobacterium sp.]|uniref:hypothetical protein n=1 Tax=Sphingobacterium sp. TaxID=341027 RepID=UPI0028ACC5ED|nr:hypothetical protein [Sphingobacterium sp.]